MTDATEKPAAKIKIATASLGGCFGCHMSLLDIDERLFELVEHVAFDRSPLTDIKTFGVCDIGLVEGGVCNAENVHVLRDMRAKCKVLVAVGACAINGGLPAWRNAIPLHELMQDVYGEARGNTDNVKLDDPELALLLDKVHPLGEVVRIDYYIPGCPPSADAIWMVLSDLVHGRTPHLDHARLQFD